MSVIQYDEVFSKRTTNRFTRLLWEYNEIEELLGFVVTFVTAFSLYKGEVLRYFIFLAVRIVLAFGVSVSNAYFAAHLDLYTLSLAVFAHYLYFLLLLSKLSCLIVFLQKYSYCLTRTICKITIVFLFVFFVCIDLNENRVTGRVTTPCVLSIWSPIFWSSRRICA